MTKYRAGLDHSEWETLLGMLLSLARLLFPPAADARPLPDPAPPTPRSAPALLRSAPRAR